MNEMKFMKEKNIIREIVSEYNECCQYKIIRAYYDSRKETLHCQFIILFNQNSFVEFDRCKICFVKNEKRSLSLAVIFYYLSVDIFSQYNAPCEIISNKTHNLHESSYIL